MFCTQCGKQNPEWANFCFSCGQPMVVAPTPQPEQNQPRGQEEGTLAAPASPALSRMAPTAGRTSTSQNCPDCGLWNVPEAVRCDCGLVFARVAATDGEPEKRPARVWRIVLGVLILLIAVSNSVRFQSEPTADGATSLGRLTGLVVLMLIAIWLIGSGLPRLLRSSVGRSSPRMAR
jgi:hypothetical protein